MTESYAKRYLKRCEEFILCAELGGKDFIGIERSKFRYTLYQYFIHGSASFYELSDDGIVSRTIGKEKQTNPVMQKITEAEFVEQMGG